MNGWISGNESIVFGPVFRLIKLIEKEGRIRCIGAVAVAAARLWPAAERCCPLSRISCTLSGRQSLQSRSEFHVFQLPVDDGSRE